MAENTTNKDFTKFHSMPVEEWGSITGGKDYIKYLEKAEKRREEDKLSFEEKHDLDRLNAYKEKGSDEKEESYEYDEGDIDWKELDQPMKVVFYLSWPRIMLSEYRQNIQGFVKSKWKEMSEHGIVKYARKKLDLIAKKEESQNEETESKQDVDTEQQEQQEKPTLWIRVAKFARKGNEKLDGYHNSVSNNREIEGKDKYTKKFQKLEQNTEQREASENNVYGDDAQIQV